MSSLGERVMHDPVAERRGTDLALGRLVDDEVAVAAGTVSPVQKLVLGRERVRFEVELDAATSGRERLPRWARRNAS